MKNNIFLLVSFIVLLISGCESDKKVTEEYVETLPQLVKKFYTGADKDWEAVFKVQNKTSEKNSKIWAEVFYRSPKFISDAIKTAQKEGPKIITAADKEIKKLEALSSVKGDITIPENEKALLVLVAKIAKYNKTAAEDVTFKNQKLAVLNTQLSDAAKAISGVIMDIETQENAIKTADEEIQKLRVTLKIKEIEDAIKVAELSGTNAQTKITEAENKIAEANLNISLNLSIVNMEKYRKQKSDNEKIKSDNEKIRIDANTKVNMKKRELRIAKEQLSSSSSTFMENKNKAEMEKAKLENQKKIYEDAKKLLEDKKKLFVSGEYKDGYYKAEKKKLDDKKKALEKKIADDKKTLKTQKDRKAAAPFENKEIAKGQGDAFIKKVVDAIKKEAPAIFPKMIIIKKVGAQYVAYSVKHLKI